MVAAVGSEAEVFDAGCEIVIFAKVGDCVRAPRDARLTVGIWAASGEPAGPSPNHGVYYRPPWSSLNATLTPQKKKKKTQT